MLTSRWAELWKFEDEMVPLFRDLGQSEKLSEIKPPLKIFEKNNSWKHRNGPWEMISTLCVMFVHNAQIWQEKVALEMQFCPFIYNEEMSSTTLRRISKRLKQQSDMYVITKKLQKFKLKMVFGHIQNFVKVNEGSLILRKNSNYFQFRAVWSMAKNRPAKLIHKFSHFVFSLIIAFPGSNAEMFSSTHML